MPPRRKRTAPQNEGQRKCRRADNKDEDTLIISDSENEEEEESASKLSSRETRWRERETRTHMQDMTEEEMLDLAMRLSKQEANSAAQRQQLEDDDIQKAIEESLHVSHSQVWEGNSVTASSVGKQSQDTSTVTARLRRKLYFPSKREVDRARDDEIADTAESGEDSMQDSKSLLPMPDLSQKTSQSPPPSPSLPSVPSTSSKEHQSSEWKSPKEQVLKVPNELDSTDEEAAQGDSETQCSAAFLRQCSVRLDKDLMSPCKASDNSQTTQNMSLSLTCPDSQLTQKQSQSLLKSPVFAKSDPKEITALSADNVSPHISKNNFTNKVCTPKNEEEDETCKESSSHKSQFHESRDHQKRLSLCRKAQTPIHSSVPDEDDDVGPKQATDQPKPLKNGSSLRTSLTAELENVPKSEDMPLHAESKSLEDFTSHMVLHLSDDDDDDDDEEDEKIVNPSPVFHQECVPHAGHPKLSPTQHCLSPPTTRSTPLCSRTQDSHPQNICTPKKCTSKTAYPAESEQQECGVQKKSACNSTSTQVINEKSDGFVSYYWGVPFCPRGQNPDDYTRVILSQLEVYEKSLKEAQHQLLHKAEWGLPLLPCRAERPFSRRMKRHRAPLLLEEEEEEPEKEEEEQKKREQQQQEEEEREERAELGEAVENEQNETYVVVSSPDSSETQKEIVQKNPLSLRQHVELNAVKPSSCRKSSPRDPSDDTQIDQPEENNKAQDENYDLESTMCPETQMSEDNTPELMVTSPAQPQLQEETEVMEVDEEAAEEERMEQEQAEEQQQQQREPVPPQCQRVECPMCSRFFPISKIEVHAAYCDGTTEETEQEEEPSQVPVLRRRNRRIETEDDTLPRSTENRSEQRNKCYLCRRFFTSEEMYIHHVDKCLKQKQSKSNQGNGLLTALHQAEQVNLDDDDSEAGPSDIMIKNHGGAAESSVVAESGGDEDGSASGFYVSSSPIKSFTPISEATDCLIDFQNQYSDRTSRRLGRKRKFKLFKMA